MSNLLLKKIFFISAALLASAVSFGQAQAQTVRPDKFPEGQEAPLPGPVQSGEVTLWQLPEDYRSVIKTEEGEVYGIYYSAWNRPNDSVLPGVFGSQWITSKDNEYQPWKGNSDLAKEISEKYFDQKKGLMSPCTGDDSLGENCVSNNKGQVQNLNLHGFWNGGGFAYGEAIANDGLGYVLRPSGSKGFGNATAYYWNGDLYRTANQNTYKIQFFAGCKLDTISSGKVVATSSLSSAEDCSEGVAPVFDGGTLEADSSGESDSNFVLFDAEGNTIDSQGNFIKFTGDFTGPGGLTFIGNSKTGEEGDHPEIQLHGNVDYEGETIVSTSGGVALVIQEESATPKGKVTIKDGAILRLRGDGINLEGDVVLEENGKIGIHGEVARIKGKVELRGDGQSIVYVSEKLPRGQKNDNNEWTRPEINGVISGKAGLTKQGEGFLVLTEKNTYTGPTKINKGALYLGRNASLSPETTVAI